MHVDKETCGQNRHLIEGHLLGRKHGLGREMPRPEFDFSHTAFVISSLITALSPPAFLASFFTFLSCSRVNLKAISEQRRTTEWLEKSFLSLIRRALRFPRNASRHEPNTAPHSLTSAQELHATVKLIICCVNVRYPPSPVIQITSAMVRQKQSHRRG
jgi:hypothetical protein